MISLFISFFLLSTANAEIHKAAVIQNGVVKNVIIIDTDNSLNVPAGKQLLILADDSKVEIGSTCIVCEGNDFIAPVHSGPSPRPSRFPR